MASLAVDYSALDSFEPTELLRLPETHSYRSRQSSHELDGDDRLLLKSSTFIHSEYTTTEGDKGFVNSVKNLRQRLRGWRLGVSLSSAMAGFVLLMNCLAAIAIHSRYGTHDGVSTAFEGDCNIANRWSLGLHIVINILSSALLSASNYTMQVLNAPTRSECDKAHARGDLLDIGIPSLHNIARITWPRKVLWLLLGVSSVPIHLFYNSAAFKTIDANLYDVVVATPNYLQNDYVPPANWNEGEARAPSGQEWGERATAEYEAEVFRQTYQSRKLDFVKLTAAACINTYGVDFVTGHSDVIAVTSGPYPANASLVAITSSNPSLGPGATLPYDWMCAEATICFGSDTCFVDLTATGACDISKLKANPSAWKMLNIPIDYCLARKVKPRCKLQFSRDILIAVMICNLCKVAAMIATLLLQQEPALVTTGDAISSWLRYPDQTTANRCLQSARTNIHGTFLESLSAHDIDSDKGCSPVVFHSSRVARWHQAINRRRWATILALCITTLAAAGSLLSMSYMNGSNASRDDIMKAGEFGAMSPETMLTTQLPSIGTSGILANVLVANMPQLIFSCLYLLYNGLFTSMCLAHEYSNYSVFRKPLRVTTPHGDQRSTHWLHLPYTYSLPLLVASAVLHWSISQSLFFVGIELYFRAELLETYFTLGHSLQPIILDIVLGSFMLFALVGMGFRKLAGKIPLANSNSFAIAAACHRPEEDKDAALKGVMWGEVHRGSVSEVGHCSFTSMDVTAPVEGRLYAGLRRRA